MMNTLHVTSKVSALESRLRVGGVTGTPARPVLGSASILAASVTWLCTPSAPDVPGPQLLGGTPVPERLFLKTVGGRFVPITAVDGGTMICTRNKAVCRCILQAQVGLQAVYQHYASAGRADVHVNMTWPAFLSMATELGVVGPLCTENQAREVFDLVNRSEAADGDDTTVDTEEFCELLARVALFYAPGSFSFEGTMEDLSTNPDFSAAFVALLDVMERHLPPSLAGVALKPKGKHGRVPDTATTASAGSGSGSLGGHAGEPARLRETVAALERELVARDQRVATLERQLQEAAASRAAPSPQAQALRKQIERAYGVQPSKP